MSTMSALKLITLEGEMKKNPELKMSDIQILREWCEKQQHLPKIEDVQLSLFLHSNYYQMEPTKNTIENYYTLRTHLPEFFSNRDIFKITRLRKMFDVVAAVLLKENTKEGYTIGFGKILDSESLNYDFNDMVKMGMMLFDEFFFTHGSQLGCIFIADATGVSFGHVARLNPMSMKKFACYIRDAIPVRLMAVHIMNTSPIVEIIFNMFKPFLSKELMNLIHFHSSVEDACNYFPMDALPNEYGGKAGSIQDLMNAHIKKIENFNEWYIEDEKINRVNESLRVGKNNVSNDLFGTDGSFRKIEID